MTGTFGRLHGLPGIPKRSRVACCLLAAGSLVACAGISRADYPILIQDHFDSENGGVPVFNYCDLTYWECTYGTVDLLGPGFDDYQPGQAGMGLFLDLDGSTGEAATLTSTTSFEMSRGIYVLEFRLAGSQRNYGPETMTVSLGPAFAEDFTRDWLEPFELVSRVIDVSEALAANLCFDQAGGDNVGLLLDDVRLVRVLPGDANLDGCVDGLDYNTWSLHYQECGHPTWSNGGYTVANFNEDTCIDGLDYNTWSLNYLTGCDGAEAPMPEPATLGLFAAGACLVLRRRRQA